MPDMREKLVELIGNEEFMCHNRECEECAYTSTFDCLAQCITDTLIDNGVTIQRWIPVTERLPEDDLPKDSKVKRIKVQVAYRTNGNWIVRTQVRAKGYWYGEPDRWDWIKMSDPITHWMPLPEPPKGE